jgi:hypothetical protein
MQIREATVEGKPIAIYDDVFTFSARSEMYHFANNSLYTIDRFTSDLPEMSQYHRTIKSSFTVTDMVRFKFFHNDFILKFIKENNLRIFNTYINLCTASDIYQYHVDSFTPGIPTMLYYLNQEWDPIWEGETHFANSTMKDILFSAAFVPGRLVIFDSTIPHKSSQPGPLAKFYRFTLAVKFTKEGDQFWNKAVNIEDFIYDKQVTLSKREKEAIDFIKPLTENIPHSNTSFFEHLYNTFCLLKKFNVSEDVCLAGLYHSVYGNEFFNANLNIPEEKVISLIGKYANDLAKMFCQNDRHYNIMSNAYKLNTRSDLDLTYIHYANIIEQTHRMNVGDHSYFASVKNKIISLEKQL